MRVSPAIVPFEANFVSACVFILFYLFVAFLELSEPFILKDVLPIPRMEHIRTPRGETLCSQQGARGNHNCHGGPHCGAWGFRPAECLAGHYLDYDRRGKCPPSGDFPPLLRNSPGFRHLQLLLCGSWSSHHLLAAHNRHDQCYTFTFLLKWSSPYVF